MITGKQLVEKLYSEGWELEQREYGLLSKMKGFISKRNLEKYYRYKGELNRLKNEKSKIQGELSNLDERAPKNMKLERAIQREAINENSFVTRYAENSNVDIKDKKIKEVLKNSINNSDRVSERDKRKLSKLIDNRDHAIYYNRNQGGPASLAHEVGHIKGEKDSIKNRIANSDSIRGSFNKADKRDGDTYFESDSNNSKFPKLKSWKRKLIDERLILSNEKDASDRALKLMKEKGATPEELNHAKKSFDKALEGYEKDLDAYSKAPLLAKYKKKTGN